jgi:hypothetical protein
VAIPSSLEPSDATSRPSTVPDTAILPVTDMPVDVVASLVYVLCFNSTVPPVPVSVIKMNSLPPASAIEILLA